MSPLDVLARLFAPILVEMGLDMVLQGLRRLWSEPGRQKQLVEDVVAQTGDREARPALTRWLRREDLQASLFRGQDDDVIVLAAYLAEELAVEDGGTADDYRGRALRLVRRAVYAALRAVDAPEAVAIAAARLDMRLDSIDETVSRGFQQTDAQFGSMHSRFDEMLSLLRSLGDDAAQTEFRDVVGELRVQMGWLQRAFSVGTTQRRAVVDGEGLDAPLPPSVMQALAWAPEPDRQWVRDRLLRSNEPSQVEALVQQPPEALRLAGPEAWEALALYAGAHGLGGVASAAYQRSARAGAADPVRGLALAALYSDWDGDREWISVLADEARARNAEHPLLRLVDAIAEQDAAAVVEAARASVQAAGRPGAAGHQTGGRSRGPRPP